MDDSRSAPASVQRINPSGPDPLIGRTVNDRYKIGSIIARGGMGKVYRAEQAPLGRLVALKVLNPTYTGENDPEFHKRFFLEASISSKLSHPNTVTIFDYGKTDDEIYYIAMELLEGRTLHRGLREEGPFDADRTTHIGRQVCRSLREAHALGVIHRDLKPANIYLVQHGDESDFVKVLDFGLVKNLAETAEDLTQAGLFMGSPKYMSPEQIRGDRVDARVDVYALGVIMFEMLTGKVPFDRPNSVNILMAHIQEQVPPMSAINPNVRVPAALEAVVRRCMAKGLDERYGSMDAVLVGLKQAAGMSATVSGEHRLESADYAATPGTGAFQPGVPGPQLPGEFLSGGTPSAFGQAPLSALPAVRATPHPRRMPLFIGMIVVLASLAGFLWMSDWVPPAPAPKAQLEPVGLNAVPIEGPARSPGATTDPVSGPEPVAVPGATGPAAAVPPPGTVVVSLRSTPPGAMVVVAGKEYGPTPTQLEWTGSEARFGREVTFRFQRKGYRDLTVTRQIRQARLDVDAPPMDPIPVRRPTREDRPSPPPVSDPGTGPLTPVQGYKTEPY